MEVIEAHDDLYWRLHALSKALESSGRIDAFDYPHAYATVLDAMNVLRSRVFADAAKQQRCELREFAAFVAAEVLADRKKIEALLTIEENALQAWYDCGCGTPELERWEVARRNLATAIRASSC